MRRRSTIGTAYSARRCTSRETNSCARYPTSGLAFFLTTLAREASSQACNPHSRACVLAWESFALLGAQSLSHSAVAEADEALLVHVESARARQCCFSRACARVWLFASPTPSHSPPPDGVPASGRQTSRLGHGVYIWSWCCGVPESRAGACPAIDGLYLLAPRRSLAGCDDHSIQSSNVASALTSNLFNSLSEASPSARAAGPGAALCG